MNNIITKEPFAGLKVREEAIKIIFKRVGKRKFIKFLKAGRETDEDYICNVKKVRKIIDGFSISTFDNCDHIDCGNLITFNGYSYSSAATSKILQDDRNRTGKLWDQFIKQVREIKAVPIVKKRN